MLLKTSITLLFLLLVIAPGVPHSNQTSCVNAQTPAKQTAKAPKKVNNYSCPMHPEVKRTRRGKCPKCGMTLRLVKEETAESPAPAVAIPAAPVTNSNELTRSISSSAIPDVEVFDQNGKKLKFASDLIKGKTVAIALIIVSSASGEREFRMRTGICRTRTGSNIGS